MCWCLARCFLYLGTFAVISMRLIWFRIDAVVMPEGIESGFGVRWVGFVDA